MREVYDWRNIAEAGKVVGSITFEKDFPITIKLSDFLSLVTRAQSTL